MNMNIMTTEIFQRSNIVRIKFLWTRCRDVFFVEKFTDTTAESQEFKYR